MKHLKLYETLYNSDATNGPPILNYPKSDPTIGSRGGTNGGVIGGEFDHDRDVSATEDPDKFDSIIKDIKPPVNKRRKRNINRLQKNIMITNFREFLDEAKLSDITTINGKFINNVFNDTELLINSMYLEHFDEEIKIIWNDTNEHSIVKKIKERTNEKSTEDFNDVLEDTINYIFNNKFDNLKNFKQTYYFFLKNRKFGFLMLIDYNADLYKVVSILTTNFTGKTTNVINIYVDDESF